MHFFHVCVCVCESVQWKVNIVNGEKKATKNQFKFPYCKAENKMPVRILKYQHNGNDLRLTWSRKKKKNVSYSFRLLVLYSNACHMVVVCNETVNGFIREKETKAIKLWNRGRDGKRQRRKMENEAKHENVMKEKNL